MTEFAAQLQEAFRRAREGDEAPVRVDRSHLVEAARKLLQEEWDRTARMAIARRLLVNGRMGR